MGLGNPDGLTDGDVAVTPAGVSCSICLEAVTDCANRSRAKLQCGHEFHLDCIGSAFNVKGEMQCPNCRKTEKGQWLFANGSRSLTDFNWEEWMHDEDLYDLGYSEMSFGVHWCPFGGLAQFPPTSDNAEFLSTAYHDLGQHVVVGDYGDVSSSSHHCPYLTNIGPIPPSSSNPRGSLSDGSNFNSHWNSQSALSERAAAFAIPSVDVHYRSWEPHSSLFPTANSRASGPDLPSILPMPRRAAGTNSEIPRQGSFVLPIFVGHGSNARSGSSVASGVPSYPGSAARARDRVQALQAYFQHPPSNSAAVHAPVTPAAQRPNHRSLAQVGPVASSSDQASGLYIFPSNSSHGRNFQDTENTPQNRYNSWDRESFSFPTSQNDREPVWGPPTHRLGGGSSTNLRQRHGYDWMPSQFRS